MTLKFHSILAANPDHLSAIGRVAVQWTQIEKALEMLVWDLASLKQPAAQALTTHISTMLLFDMAKAMAAQRLAKTALEDRLKAQLNHINNTLRVQRNKIIHGVWGPTASPEKIACLETTARGEVKFVIGEEMTANDILHVAAEIDQAHFSLVTLSLEIASYLGQVSTINAQEA